MFPRYTKKRNLNSYKGSISLYYLYLDHYTDAIFSYNLVENEHRNVSSHPSNRKQARIVRAIQRARGMARARACSLIECRGFGSDEFTIDRRTIEQ